MKFSELPIKPQILDAVHALGFETMTSIQEQCIPMVLEGRDVVGQSSTGSGKTAAFGLPMLDKIHRTKGLQALVLTPTRELCVQVTDALRDYAKLLHLTISSVYGGVGYGPQEEAMHRSEIIVGTPGRVLDHLQRGTLKLDNVTFFVLDEADKMFEMGFIESVDEIMTHLPAERQNLLFSATMPGPIVDIVNKFLRDPIYMQGTLYVDRGLLKQQYYVVHTREKFSLLGHLLQSKTEGLSLVFCATRQETDIVARNLKQNGFRAMAIHGGQGQGKRLHALDALRNERISILVATDVAARGLDVKNVTSVFNYDVPKSPEDYIHRIGRTARAGEAGSAVTLLAERDFDNFSRILRDHSIEITEEPVPNFPQLRFSRFQDQGRGEGRRGFQSHGRAGRYGDRQGHGGGGRRY